jgi:hypothetical protein
MGTVDNLRVGPRMADEVEHLRQQRMQEARELFEREFIAAVLADDPWVEVSRVKVHSGDREVVPVLDMLYELVFEGGSDESSVHLQRLLHLLARRDDGDSAVMLQQLAQAYADSQVDLLEQRGAL